MFKKKSVLSFTEFVLKFNLKRQAYSNIKVKGAEQKSTKYKNLHEKQKKTTKDGIVSFHSNKNTHWVC